MLSLVGGFFSLIAGLWIPTVFPEFIGIPEFMVQVILFVTAFLTTLKTMLIVGGAITILGAILYSMDKLSSGSVILIGAFLGGINIISLFGGGIAFAECTRIKKRHKLDQIPKKT